MKRKRYSLRTNEDEVIFETNYFFKLEDFLRENNTTPYTNFNGDKIELKLFDFGEFTGKIY